MTRLAPSAAPPNAIKVWTDGIRVFAEIGGYISAYSLTESGLSQVLNLIRDRRVDYSGAIQLSIKPAQSLREAAAEAILRRKGII